MNFIEELKWRQMIHTTTPGIEEMLQKGGVVGYTGFDPTASSLHIGHLVPIMLLTHFQRSGNKPIALVGGATGMIGDPSGKSLERNLLSEDAVRYNQECVQKQLEKFLDFSGKNSAEIVNNYDWFGKFDLLSFFRDVGKHLTVNYMVSKDSVKNRWDSGISFTEFSYQLLQAYDFYWLYTNKNCALQMGGSDQWGNMTSGTELVRRKAGGEAFALTCPLLKRSDGKKFGKTEGGECVWLDSERTSPYKFFQYWLNVADSDALALLKTFTLLSREEIENLCAEHEQKPHERPMQKALAKDITTRVHSESDYRSAVEASEILFGKGTSESLMGLSEDDFLSIFEGVPQFNISKSELENGIDIVELVSAKTSIFPSKGEGRRMIAQGGLSINKNKITDVATVINDSQLIKGRYLLFQKGKKSYFIINAE